MCLHRWLFFFFFPDQTANWAVSPGAGSSLERVSLGGCAIISFHLNQTPIGLRPLGKATTSLAPGIRASGIHLGTIMAGANLIAPACSILLWRRPSVILCIQPCPRKSVYNGQLPGRLTPLGFCCCLRGNLPPQGPVCIARPEPTRHFIVACWQHLSLIYLLQKLIHVFGWAETCRVTSIGEISQAQMFRGCGGLFSLCQSRSLSVCVFIYLVGITMLMHFACFLSGPFL